MLSAMGRWVQCAMAWEWRYFLQMPLSELQSDREDIYFAAGWASQLDTISYFLGTAASGDALGLKLRASAPGNGCETAGGRLFSRTVWLEIWPFCR